ncbi:MAG TPA: hypothetical protein VHG93_05325 [Longimicrobium sp.]|nr:hypothetical protein [Longimicrobium sp.]
MPLTVDVRETQDRMEAMVDAVLQGEEVLITHLGEPVGVLGMHSPAGEEPPPGLRAVMLEVFGKAMEHIRDRLDPPLWRMN